MIFLADQTYTTFVTIGVLIICVQLFVFTYVINKKTPRPDGCEGEGGQECEGCGLLGCSNHPNNKEEKKEDNSDVN